MIRHLELDGPFSVPTAWSAETVDGVETRTPTAFRDDRWNTTLGFYARNRGALEPYQVTPPRLARVWMLDDPEDPQATVALAFPDPDTAEAVLLGCGATLVDPDEPPAEG